MELLIACFDDDIKAEGLHFSLLRGAKESADLPQKMEDSVIAVRMPDGGLKWLSWNYSEVDGGASKPESIVRTVAHIILQHPIINNSPSFNRESDSLAPFDVSTFTDFADLNTVVSLQKIMRSAFVENSEHIGITTAFLKKIADLLKPGCSMLVMLVDKATADELGEFDNICTGVLRTTIEYNKEKLDELFQVRSDAYNNKMSELIQQKVLAEQKQIYGTGFKALLTRLFHI